MSRGGKRPGAGRPRKRPLPPEPRPDRREGPAADPQEIIARMWAELDATTAHLDEIEEAIVDQTIEDKDGHRRALMLKAVSLAARSGVAKSLATAARTLREVGTPKGKKEEAERAAIAASETGDDDWAGDLATPGMMN